MLVICPTPIGNLGDVTQRQREALCEADIIACEDTRRAGKLLEMLGIGREDGRPRLWRYDDHTAQAQAESLVDEIRQGQKVVLTSDAGTPTISDPGYRLVRACRDRGVEVTSLPGPVAAMVALSGSGLATDRFYFGGFLPATHEKRRDRLQELVSLDATVVLYESPRRIVDALGQLQEVCDGEREVCVARELTKLHEEYLVGGIGEVREELASRSGVRGEIVLCISAAPATDKEEAKWQDVDQMIDVLARQGLRSRTIKDVVAEIFGVARSKIYDRIDQVVEDGGGND